ncbi:MULTISPECIES: DUF4397 domain-containing protein [Bacillaceae]|uniref:DUF4397 domain-containing protein n=1 Tax=Evansella alkalicola TaxID=745819 RepID=A0ABS6JND9_9BACI|nr:MULTISPECIES: DUF4397 domain-containing protein [Bacillaceae]MBU9720065.1 DUF4397 domain-containing protein [Bacillus alkalicola]
MKKLSVSIISILILFSVFIPCGVFAHNSVGVNFRFLHASIGLNREVDVYINQDLVFDGVRFKELTEYTIVKSGELRVQIFSAGADPKEGEEIYTDTLKTANGDTYTISIFDDKNHKRILSWKDDLVVDKDKAKLRLVHLHSEIPTVSVLIEDKNFITDIAFTDSSEYKSMEPQTINMDIKDSKQGHTFYKIPNLKLSSGENYTVIIMNTEGNLTLDVIISLDKLLSS